MEIEHLAIMVQERVKKYGEKPALRFKNHSTGQWKEISWSAMGEQIHAAAKGLIDMGVKEGDMVGLFSQNRPEWAITDFAIQSVRAVSVPIYATNSAAQARYIVNDAQIKVIFVGDQGQVEKISSVTGECPSLDKIIAFNETTDPTAGEQVLSFRDLLTRGQRSELIKEIDARLQKCSPQDLATLIYTSGTTGDPKGVMLTHANFFHQINAVKREFPVDEQDVSLCFLPLSHAFERTWSYFVLYQGGAICYCDDFKKITDYLKEVKPTIMVSVPRLFEKIYNAITAKFERASSIQKNLFQWALSQGRQVSERIRMGKTPGFILRGKLRLADFLVLKKIREIFGGRLKFIGAGGSPLSRELEEFFHAAGLLICQGYGLTETSPTISCNTPGSYKFGTVGKVLPGCQVKLSEVGEILVKGDNLMLGYYKKPEKVAEAFVDGWFKTGDVGEFDGESFLKITDRIKDLIITSSGKNISPQNIESCLTRNPYIEQAAVFGNRRHFVSALIVPSFPALETFARSQKIVFSHWQELVSHPEVISFYRQVIDQQSRDLAECEKIKKFTLLPQEFSLESGEITPTLKLKRNVIEKSYSELIDRMYGEKA